MVAALCRNRGGPRHRRPVRDMLAPGERGARAMARKLVVLLDGTGNEIGTNLSNVLK